MRYYDVFDEVAGASIVATCIVLADWLFTGPLWLYGLATVIGVGVSAFGRARIGV